MNLHIIYIVLAFSVVVEAQSSFFYNIFAYLFGPFLDFFVRNTCNTILDYFDDATRFDCRCKGIYANVTDGVGGRVKCRIDDPVCLINRPVQLFCGEADVAVTFSSRNGISKVKGCVDVTSHFPKDFPIPIDDVTQFPELCVTVVPTNMELLTLQSCEITFDDDVCSSCIVCESQRDVIFDCRNVNINPAKDVEPTFIEGPFVNECVGFGFLFGTVTDPPTIAPTPPVPPSTSSPVASIPTNTNSTPVTPTTATPNSPAPVMTPTNATAPSSNSTPTAGP